MKLLGLLTISNLSKKPTTHLGDHIIYFTKHMFVSTTTLIVVSGILEAYRHSLFGCGGLARPLMAQARAQSVGKGRGNGQTWRHVRGPCHLPAFEGEVPVVDCWTECNSVFAEQMHILEEFLWTIFTWMSGAFGWKCTKAMTGEKAYDKASAGRSRGII